MADVEYPEPGKGPFGVTAPSKAQKAEDLAKVTAPEVTSVNPEPYTEEELNHRFNHVPGESFAGDPAITIQGIND
ncbi:hypothetical protein [Mycobacterium phage Azrael100]|nr:hypothetical protein [Mycobacterium phage Azrael100]